MDILQALNQIWQTTGIYAISWQQLTMIAVCCFQEIA